MIKVEEDARDENLTYLFEWNEVVIGKHKDKFAEFLRRATGSITLDLLDLKFTNDSKTITCNFISDADHIIWTARMTGNNENTIATLSITNDLGKEVYRFQMIIKEEPSNRFPRYRLHHLYFKDNRSTKAKRRRGK